MSDPSRRSCEGASASVQPSQLPYRPETHISGLVCGRLLNQPKKQLGLLARLRARYPSNKGGTGRVKRNRFSPRKNRWFYRIILFLCWTEQIEFKTINKGLPTRYNYIFWYPNGSPSFISISWNYKNTSLGCGSSMTVYYSNFIIPQLYIFNRWIKWHGLFITRI